MRGLPMWMIGCLAILSVALLVVGYEERDHLGPLPLILGVVWVLFTFAALGAKTKFEAD